MPDRTGALKLPIQITKEACIVMHFEALMHEVYNAKPEERSELARRYAVVLTMMEQAYAYFQTFINKGDK